MIGLLLKLYLGSRNLDNFEAAHAVGLHAVPGSVVSHAHDPGRITHAEQTLTCVCTALSLDGWARPKSNVTAPAAHLYSSGHSASHRRRGDKCI